MQGADSGEFPTSALASLVWSNHAGLRAALKPRSDGGLQLAGVEDLSRASLMHYMAATACHLQRVSLLLGKRGWGATLAFANGSSGGVGSGGGGGRSGGEGGGAGGGGIAAEALLRRWRTEAAVRSVAGADGRRLRDNEFSELFALLAHQLAAGGRAGAGVEALPAVQDGRRSPPAPAAAHGRMCAAASTTGQLASAMRLCLRRGAAEGATAQARCHRKWGGDCHGSTAPRRGLETPRLAELLVERI